MTSQPHDPLELLRQLDTSVVLLHPVVNERNTVTDAHVVWVNARAQSVWGEGNGRLASAVCPDFDEWLAAANGAWRSGPVRRLIEADHGRRGWTRAVSTVSRVDDHLAEVTVDRSADQELIDRLAMLDRQYRSLLAELPLTVLAARLDRMELDYVSPRAEELTGRPLSELGSLLVWRDLSDPSDPSAVEAVEAVLEGGGEADGVARILRPDGSVRVAEVRAVRTEPGIDQMGWFVVTLLDVTEHHEMQRRAEQSERLETLARSAGSFAHEFSSLLQIIGGNLERLHSSPGVALKPLQQSVDAVARAGALVNGLMSFASGRPGAVEPVSIPVMCQSMHTVLRDRLPESVHLEIDIHEGIPDVLIAAEALSVVMLQIIENAAAALPDGGTVRIEVCEASSVACHMAHAVALRRWVCISVTDDGVGIDDDRLRRVWEPFHTSRVGAAARGAGLGLSMVHGVVHQFDGHVSLESCPNTGTTVTLYLPAVDA